MRRSVRAVPDAVLERLIPYASKLLRIGVCSPLRSLRGRSRRRGRGVCRLDRFLVGPDVAQKHMRIKALVSIRAWPSSFYAPLEAAGRARTAASSRVGAYRADERPPRCPQAPSNADRPSDPQSNYNRTTARVAWLPISQSRHGHHDGTSDRRRGGSSPCRTG